MNPVNSPMAKLKNPPQATTNGKGKRSPSTADVYIPTPKNVAVAKDMYRVGPQNMAQLTVRTTYMRMLVTATVV
jgi:hypothetical protein